jgi:hypothetical protein
MDLRNRLNPKHPVVGINHRVMTDTELLVGTDETARVSLLLSLDGEPWRSLSAAYPEAVGVTVGYAITKMGDMDAAERVFRRCEGVMCPLCHARVRVIADNGDGCVDCIDGNTMGVAARDGIESGYINAYRVSAAKMVAGLKARGAHYPEDNFYGLVHETAHGFDLGLPNADPKAINVELSRRTEYERLQAEVVAKTVARGVSAFYGAPLLRDGIRYAARSVKGFAERDGTKVSWVPEDFVDETVRLHGSSRCFRVMNQTLGVINTILDN